MARSPRRSPLGVDPSMRGPRPPQTGGGLINNTGIRPPFSPQTGGGLINNTGIKQNPSAMPVQPPQMIPNQSMQGQPPMGPPMKPMGGNYNPDPGYNMLQQPMPGNMNNPMMQAQLGNQQMSPMLARMKMNRGM